MATLPCMSVAAVSPTRPDRFRTFALAALLAAFAFRAKDVLSVLSDQPAGADYSAFWAGTKALADPARLYDFAYVTALQGWPFGHDHFRPFLYPPSALFAFLPTAALPYWVGYVVWCVATYALFAWAGRRMGAPWWMILFPVVWLVALCGQITFLVGGLVAAALTLRHRPILAGVLLGVAAALKPQLLVFAPLGLIAAREWKTLLAAGLTGLAACLASAAIWGVDPWIAWLAALPRFHTEVLLKEPVLLAHSIAPAALFNRAGLSWMWTLLLAPFAVALVWTTFRRTTYAPDRLVAVFAAALMISAYAMHYEACLFAPAVAAYLARTEDRLWPFYASIAVLFTMGLVYCPAPLAMALLLPASSWLRLDGEGARAWRPGGLTVAH